MIVERGRFCESECQVWLTWLLKRTRHMNKKTAHRPCLRTLFALAMPLLLAGLVAPAHAQEQFFTQSGGRGLQNAKTNARLSKVEGDVDTLNTEMAKVKPHAKAELGSCPDAGDKLRYTGTNWVCERETDPTVQGFAKKTLPTCTGGSILGVQGGDFSCVQSGFVSNETDPTVQAFAKSPLPSCGENQVLKVSNGILGCITDQVGLSREVDPEVHDFARKDVVAAVPNCGANEVLTMTGGRLSCKLDSVGITQEVDPFTASFARTDIPGYALAACPTGKILTAVNDASNKVILQCADGSTALGEALNLSDLKDVDTTGETSGTVLMFDGTLWKAKSEADPTVPAWAKTNLNNCAAGQVLSYLGGTLQCVNDAGGSSAPLTFAGLGDVNVTGVTDGKFVKYDLATHKWIPATVAAFAQATLPTCTTGQILTGDGTSLSCVNDAGGAGDPVDLVELGDVRTGPSTNLSPANNDFLRYDTATSKWKAVHDKLSATQTTSDWCYYNGTDVVCDRGPPKQCGNSEILSWNTTGNAFGCVSATTVLGLGTMAYQNSNNVSVTGGVMNGVTIGGSNPADGTFTNIRVTGNLSVSGSQTIDGVSFANGGVSATGIISATYFSGDGSKLTNIPATSLNVPGAVGDVQIKGVDGFISATSHLNWSESGHNLGVSGTVQVGGTGSEPCDAASAGKMRVVQVGAGDTRLQFCAP